MPNWRDLVQQHLPELSRDPAREAEVVEELEQHLEDRYRTALSSGLSEEDALREVLREFANSEIAADQIRRLKKTPAPAVATPSETGLFSGLLRDLVYSFRLMRRHKGFSLFSILILAFGLASNSAIFSVVNSVLLRPLPYPESDRIVILGHPTSTGRPSTLGFATLQDWRQSAKSFEKVSALRSCFGPAGRMTGQSSPT